MPQKPVLKAGKKIEKKNAANRHGKSPQQRKGRLEKPPKKAKDLELYMENKELSKVINNTNESNFATMAQGKGGGRLKTLKGPPPALAPKDKMVKAKAAKKAQQKEEDAKMDEDEEVE